MGFCLGAQVGKAENQAGSLTPRTWLLPQVWAFANRLQQEPQEQDRRCLQSAGPERTEFGSELWGPASGHSGPCSSPT